MSQSKYDLCVVGAGSGGIGAALAAARMGLSVLLIEKSDTLGGNAVRGGVHNWEPGVGGTAFPFEIFQRLQNFAVQERYGMVWVRLSDHESAPLPEVPEFENSDWTYIVAPPMRFQSGYRREVENYLDMSHFAFAHSTTLGVAANPIIPPMKIEEYEDGFLMDAPFPSLESPHEQPGQLQEGHRRRQRCYLPNFTTIRQSFADGDERVLVHIPSPISREECNVFWALAISPGFRGPAPESQVEFDTAVLNEDREMCENQIPQEVPVNPVKGGWGVLVMPGDTLANTFQKTHRQWLMRCTKQAEAV